MTAVLARLVVVLLAVTGGATTSAARRGVPYSQRPPVPIGCVALNGTPSPPWLSYQLVEAAGWPRAEARNVCRLVGCESVFDPTSVGRYRPPVYGLAQLMATSLPWSALLAAHGWTAADLLDSLRNLTIAREGWELLGRRYNAPGGWQCAGALGLP